MDVFHNNEKKIIANVRWNVVIYNMHVFRTTGATLTKIIIHCQCSRCSPLPWPRSHVVEAVTLNRGKQTQPVGAFLDLIKHICVSPGYLRHSKLKLHLPQSVTQFSSFTGTSFLGPLYLPRDGAGSKSKIS